MQSNALLPLVDSEFLLVYRRQDRLDAYARGLVQHLRQIRSGGKAGGYPIATIKAAAVWLIQSYVEAGVVLAPPAAELIRELIDPNKDASTLPVRTSSEAAFLAAIEFEARHPSDPKRKEPSSASCYSVAKHIRPLLLNRHSSQKTAEATIRGWRKLRYYRENVALQHSRKR